MTSQFDAEKDATKRKQTSPASKEDASRRKFLNIAVGGAIAGLATTAGLKFAAPSSALAQSRLTPDEALDLLVKGNKNFVDGKLTSFDLDLAILRNHTSELQQPFAAVLACSDSRVPVELVFDQTIGHIFVARVAGNFINSEIIASLEYGTYKLGAKVILVMGHGSCGAVEATIAHAKVPGQISALYPHLQPAVDKSGPDSDEVSKTNALIQAALLRKSSTVISSLVASHQLRVIAAFYNIASGVVTLLE